MLQKVKKENPALDRVLGVKPSPRVERLREDYLGTEWIAVIERERFFSAV